LPWFKFESGIFQLFYLYLCFLVENHICLSRGVQVVGTTWRTATRIMAGVGDLVQRNGDGLTGRVLGGWTIGRSGDAVCGLHRARGDEEHRFLG
jgi:hypothetical protein